MQSIVKFNTEKPKYIYTLKRLGNIENYEHFIHNKKEYVATNRIENYYGRICYEKNKMCIRGESENISIFTMVYEISEK